EPELGKDRLGLRAEPAGAPLLREAFAQLQVAVRRIEDAPNDELRRGRPVPRVLLEPEGDVVAADAPEPVELRAEAEGDRAPGRATGVRDPEAEVLPVAHRGGGTQLPAGDG